MNDLEINKTQDLKKLWQNHYRHYDFFQNKLDWYLDTVQFHIGNMDSCQKILDTGAGSGNLTVELLKNQKDVTALDDEPYCLEILSQKVKDMCGHIDIIRADAQKLPFDECNFDGVTSMFLVPFLEDNEKYSMKFIGF